MPFHTLKAQKYTPFGGGEPALEADCREYPSLACVAKVSVVFSAIRGIFPRLNFRAAKKRKILQTCLKPMEALATQANPSPGFVCSY